MIELVPASSSALLIAYPNKDDVKLKLDQLLQNLEVYRETQLLDNVPLYFANVMISDELESRRVKLWQQSLLKEKNIIEEEENSNRNNPNNRSKSKKKN
jgi:hypothetical protein